MSNGSHSTINNSNNNNNLQFHNMNNNQPGWSQRNHNQNPLTNNQWNQTGERNAPPFLDQWPTPWEASRSAKMLVRKILEEVTSKIMSF